VSIPTFARRRAGSSRIDPQDQRISRTLPATRLQGFSFPDFARFFIPPRPAGRSQATKQQTTETIEHFQFHHPVGENNPAVSGN
jgi:hypothetical protein